MIAETLYGVAQTYNNLSNAQLLIQQYEVSFLFASRAREILGEYETPELQRSIDILSRIKEEVGSEAYQRITKDFEKSSTSTKL